MNYGYKLKWDYITGTLRNFDPIKNYYIFQPTEALERPLIAPLEALQPSEQSHTYHLGGTVTNQAFLNDENSITDVKQQISKRKYVKQLKLR